MEQGTKRKGRNLLSLSKDSRRSSKKAPNGRPKIKGKLKHPIIVMEKRK